MNINYNIQILKIYIRIVSGLVPKLGTVTAESNYLMFLEEGRFAHFNTIYEFVLLFLLILCSYEN